MFSVSHHLADRLVQNEIISKEDYEVYRFGIECFIMKAVHIITYLLLGLWLHMLRELVVFLIVFIPLRVYSGGYHAKTPLNCYFVSCGAVLTAIFMMKNAPSFIMNHSIIWAFAVSLLLFIIVPVESSNKPLDSIEKNHYKKKAGIIIMVSLGLVTVLRVFSLNYISYIITLSLTYELGIALFGVVIKDSQ